MSHKFYLVPGSRRTLTSSGLQPTSTISTSMNGVTVKAYESRRSTRTACRARSPIPSVCPSNRRVSGVRWTALGDTTINKVRMQAVQ